MILRKPINGDFSWDSSPMIKDRALNQQIIRHQSTKLTIKSYFDKQSTVEFTADNKSRDNTGRKLQLDNTTFTVNNLLAKEGRQESDE